LSHRNRETVREEVVALDDFVDEFVTRDDEEPRLRAGVDGGLGA